jgi:hypothetical protein
VLTKDASGYRLTAKGEQLWPLIWSTISWGNENYLEKPSRRTYRHAECDGLIGHDRVCQRCEQVPDDSDLAVHPPRRPVSRALERPHRMLEPLLAPTSSGPAGRQTAAACLGNARRPRC